VDDTIASLKRRLQNLMRELVDADEYSKAALKAMQTEIVAAIREAEQRRAVYKKQRVPIVPDERIRTVAQFGARLGKGLENAKTFADRLSRRGAGPDGDAAGQGRQSDHSTALAHAEGRHRVVHSARYLV
jgi:hypothetical protein